MQRPHAHAFAVVVSYNGAAWIDDCIRHLLAGTVAPQVVVVDNASTDNTVALASAFQTVHVIRNSTNLGFGRANNIGIAHALRLGAEAVLLVNQDACIAPEMLEELIKVARSNPDLGIVCPLQWTEDGRQLDESFLRFYLAETATTLLSDAVRGELEPVYRANTAPAAIWLCTRSMLLAVGGFDPLYFMYAEDDDLCRRAAAHGYALAIATRAHFRHLRGFHARTAAEAPRVRFRRRRNRFLSNFILVAKDERSKFAVQLWRATTTTLTAGMLELLNHGDVVVLAATAAAVGSGLARAGVISRHRRLGTLKGPHWLAGFSNGNEAKSQCVDGEPNQDTMK